MSENVKDRRGKRDMGVLPAGWNVTAAKDGHIYAGRQEAPRVIDTAPRIRLKNGMHIPLRTGAKPGAGGLARRLKNMKVTLPKVPGSNSGTNE